MKTHKIFIVLFTLVCLVSSQAYSQKKNVSAEIKVYGNCGMCKERIEDALDKTGIKTATWSPATKMLHVVYNSRKISEKDIHELLASAGHDTDQAKATNEVYSELPFCCLYRDHDHSGIKDEGHHKNH